MTAKPKSVPVIIGIPARFAFCMFTQAISYSRSVSLMRPLMAAGSCGCVKSMMLRGKVRVGPMAVPDFTNTSRQSSSRYVA